MATPSRQNRSGSSPNSGACFRGSLNAPLLETPKDALALSQRTPHSRMQGFSMPKVLQPKSYTTSENHSL